MNSFHDALKKAESARKALESDAAKEIMSKAEDLGKAVKKMPQEEREFLDLMIEEAGDTIVHTLQRTDDVVQQDLIRLNQQIVGYDGPAYMIPQVVKKTNAIVEEMLKTNSVKDLGGRLRKHMKTVIGDQDLYGRITQGAKGVRNEVAGAEQQPADQERNQNVDRFYSVG